MLILQVLQVRLHATGTCSWLQWIEWLKTCCLVEFFPTVKLKKGHAGSKMSPEIDSIEIWVRRKWVTF